MNRLRWALSDVAATRAVTSGLAAAVARFDWSALAGRYDKTFAALSRPQA